MITTLASSENIGKDKFLEVAEDNYQKFILELRHFIVEWNKKTFNYFLKSYPNSLKRLNEKQLLQMKIELQYLNKIAPDLIEEAFAREEKWWHKSNSGIDIDYYRSINNLVDDEIKKVFGLIGNIFYDFGFVSKSMHEPYRGFLTKKDGSNLYYYEYVHPIYWSDMMKRRMDNYWEVYKYYKKNS